MNARKICILLVVCVLFFCSVVPFRAEADDIVLDNDGIPRKNPYGICAVRPSFTADYYDCYIPYALTCKEIGGISVGGGHGVMSSWDMNKKVSAKVNYEGNLSWDFTQYFLKHYAGDYKASFCEHTDAIVLTDSKGTQFYMTALGYFFYASNIDGTNKFPGWSTENRGQLVDVILTDGTVIHFVVADAKAQVHTNGSSGYYVCNKLNYPQYKYLFQAYAGEVLEIFGKSGNCVNKFMSYYNMGSGEGQNQVAYIRMYNHRIRDSDAVRKEGIPKGVGFTHDNVSIVANPDGYRVPYIPDNGENDGGNEGEDNNENDGNESPQVGVPEYELDGMPDKSNFSMQGTPVELKDRDDLSISELNSLQFSKEALSIRRSVNAYDTARNIMVFVGLLLFVYVLLMLLATLFDRVNSFIDISLLSVITLGALKISNEEDTKGKSGYASNSKLIGSMLVLTIVSMLLITGAVIPWVMQAVHYVTEWIGNIF